MRVQAVCILAVVLVALCCLEASAATIYGNDFEGSVGSEWSHTSTSVTLAGGRRFLGEFGNDSVTLSLSGLPSHSQLLVEFDLFVLKSWDGNLVIHPGSLATIGPDRWSFTAEGSTLLDTTFSNVTMASSGIVAYQAYPDNYPGPDNLPRTGALEANTLGYMGTGPNQRTEGDTVYRLGFLIPHTASTINLEFAGATTTIPGGTDIQDESWGIDNLSIVSVPEPSSVSLAAMALVCGAAWRVRRSKLFSR